MLIAAALKRGQPLPESIQNAPDLEEGLIPYWVAYCELETTRPLGALGGAGWIPWTAVDAYGYRYGIWGDDFDYLLALIRAMDEEFLDHVRSKGDG